MHVDVWGPGAGPPVVLVHGDDPRAFLIAFTERLGGDPTTVPDPLPEHVRQHVELLMHERFPWEAQIDLRLLSNAAPPAMVVSGGHDRMQEAVSDAVAGALGSSTQRIVIPGAAHVVQRTGEPFNDALESFFRSASS